MRSVRGGWARTGSSRRSRTWRRVDADHVRSPGGSRTSAAPPRRSAGRAWGRDLGRQLVGDQAPSPGGCLARGVPAGGPAGLGQRRRAGRGEPSSTGRRGSTRAGRPNRARRARSPPPPSWTHCAMGWLLRSLNTVEDRRGDRTRRLTVGTAHCRRALDRPTATDDERTRMAPKDRPERGIRQALTYVAAVVGGFLLGALGSWPEHRPSASPDPTDAAEPTSPGR